MANANGTSTAAASKRAARTDIPKSTPIEDACGENARRGAFGAGKAAVTEYLRMISAGPFVKLDRHRIDSLLSYQKTLLSAKWSPTYLLGLSIDFLEGFTEQTDLLMIDAEKANGRSVDKAQEQTVPPVVAAKDAAKPDISGNAGLEDGDVIRMDAQRAKRFYSTLAELFDTTTSLRTAVDAFPDPQCNPGQIEPRVAVLSFASHLDHLLDFMGDMINNREESEE